MCLLEDGSVYVWGKNDEGQVGLGNTYTEVKKKHLEEVQKWEEERRVRLEEKRKQKEAEEKSKQEEEEKKKKEAEEAGEEIKPKKKSYYVKVARPDPDEDAQPPELTEAEQTETLFFPRPKKLEGLPKIKQIACGTTFSYAVAAEEPKVYSWGMGENYVLGSRDDEN